MGHEPNTENVLRTITVNNNLKWNVNGYNYRKILLFKQLFSISTWREKTRLYVGLAVRCKSYVTRLAGYHFCQVIKGILIEKLGAFGPRKRVTLRETGYRSWCQHSDEIRKNTFPSKERSFESIYWERREVQCLFEETRKIYIKVRNSHQSLWRNCVRIRAYDGMIWKYQLWNLSRPSFRPSAFVILTSLTIVWGPL
jgi:hypothetical protein